MGLIHVAAGAIEDAAGRILVTRRPDNVHQGGLWEFPGGKLEPGETCAQGLVRELEEELGIRVRTSRPLIRVHHDYGDRHVLLDVHRVTAFVGKPHGREGQPLDWVHPREMVPDAFPAADRPIISALRLPQFYLITGQNPTDADPFLARISEAVSAGVRLVQLRAHQLGAEDYARLAERAFAICEAAGAILLLNRDTEEVRGLHCHGVHLSGNRLGSLKARPRGDLDWVGASCHTAADLVRASELGLDYALLSPVQRTASHPDAEPLGWKRFGALTDRARLPVYALGGLRREDLDRAVECGAQGIAAIGGLWR
jgi:8-oxo-dGTP diphosphatase